MKVHLVDGTYELFRAYFARPRSSGRDGREVGAAKGLFHAMRRLVEMPGVTHVAVAFDHVIESFRNRLFDGYKTGAGIEPELLGQFELAEQACRALGLVVWPMVEFEADDALATAARRLLDEPASDRPSQVVICTPDKDLAQCVRGDRVVCWDSMRDRVYGESEVVAKHGVEPASIPDYLALMGDSADGIPGIPRWGKKSAANVLSAYSHLEAIPRDASKWSVKVRGAETLARELFDRFEDALLYRKLATLRTDVPLSEGLSELEYRGARRAPLEAFCREVEDDSLFERTRLAD